MSEIEERIPTHIWVMAQVRTAFNDGRPTMVLQKGEANSGVVLVKISKLDGTCRLLMQQRDIDGILGWASVFKEGDVLEPQADDYIRRAGDRDGDLWIVESEDPQGQNPFEGPEHNFG